MRRTSVVPAVSLLVAALAALWPFAPAVAGGPTSVLLSVPGEGRTTALYYTDPAYDRLAAEVGITGEPVELVAGSHESGTPVTITWLIHDVTPWRIDRVYVDADGTAWVSTQQSIGEGPLDTAEPVWHVGGAALPRLLDRLLPGGDGSAGGSGLSTVAPAPQPEPAATAQPATVTDGSTPLLLAGVGLAGLVVGVAATLAASVVRRPREVQTPTDDSASTGERLVWP